jgi:hypothetical protein
MSTVGHSQKTTKSLAKEMGFASSHCAFKCRTFLKQLPSQNKIPALEHPSYSPDLTLCLFHALKTKQA